MANGTFPTFRVALERTASPRSGQTPPLRARVVAYVHSTLLGEIAVEFRVDSGAGITLMSVACAEQFGIPVQQTLISIDTLTQSGSRHGQSFFIGALFARFPEVPHRVFCFGCYFNPVQPEDVPPVMGLGGDLLKHLRITFDGAPSPDMPYGFAMIEVVSPDPATGQSSTGS